MIDWLTLDIPFKHSGIITGGKVASIKEDGTIEWETTKFKQVEGSYDSTISIRTKEILEDKTALITISGNPAKFLQGHNLFGSDNLQGLAYDLAHKVLEKLNIPPNRHFEAVMRHGIYDLKRVDCTLNFRMPSRDAVRAWIREASKVASGRHQKTSAYSEKTLYIGQNSRRISLKIYCKGDEIKAHSLNEKIPSVVFRKLTEYADTILRCEVTMRAKELKERNLDHGYHWDDISLPGEIVRERLSAMKLPENVFLDNTSLEGLKPRLKLIYNSWATGKDLRMLLGSKQTYYRYRSELLPHGIDLSSPPSKTKADREVPLRQIFESIPLGIPGWAVDTEYFHEGAIPEEPKGEK